MSSVAPAMQIEPVSPARHESLIDLMIEMREHYSEGPSLPRPTVREHLQQRLLAPGSSLRLAVAVLPEQGVVGLLAFQLLHSLVDPRPMHGRQCQLKELYVRAAHRGQGVGRQLMLWLARHAVDQGCGRMDWHVRSWNERGIAFYRALGAEPVADRLSFRLSGPALRRLADTRG